MIYKEHFVELWVNKQKCELESQDSLNIRMNNVLCDPTKIGSTQAEYSFEFELPCTPTNNKIFNYANNLSKLNKFHTRWDAVLYADGKPIFEGTLTLNSCKDDKYKVNLVSVKNDPLDEIFGDSVLTDIPWEIPFDGVSTINERNSQVYNNNSREVYFPLVSYGAFQKSPYYKDEVASDYTSKYDLDNYNRWYVESFPPSLNLLETIRKAFEWKGYKVQGDAFTNYFLRDVYMSTNLADGQSPTYNLGNYKFGSVDLTVSWTTRGGGSAFTQDLKFPYWRVGGKYSGGKFIESEFNFSTIQVYDMLEEGTVTLSDGSYMYQPNEHVIVIPADGFYKITLSGNSHFNTSSSLYAEQWAQRIASERDLEKQEVEIPADMVKTMPLEVQLVRNYDENIELIKGKNNYIVEDGRPANSTTAVGTQNLFSFPSSFPHEKCGSVFYYGNNGNKERGKIEGSVGDWVYAPPTDIDNFGDASLASMYNWDFNVGYLFNNVVMAYDPVVSPIFICGFTTMGNDNGGGCGAVIKNGYSWSKMYSEKNESFYTQRGYDKASTTYYTTSVGNILPTWNLSTTASTYNKNECIDSHYYRNPTTNNVEGRIECIVKLNKNDVLQLFAVQRDYHDSDGNQLNYSYTNNYRLKIEAASPKSYNALIKEGYGFNSPSEFNYNLKLTDFLNKETKVSDWIGYVKDAFNLDLKQYGNVITVDVKNKLSDSVDTAVDVDDRVNSSEAESSIIEYPRSMAVKYKIDTDEHGFYTSVPTEHIEDDDWKKYGDYGYNVIYLNDDTYVTNKEEKQTQFSYTWYDTFRWHTVDSAFTSSSETTVSTRIPVISKEEWMIDGYDYTESMKHDGYGLSQRFWFKPTTYYGTYVWTRTYPAERVMLYLPTNSLVNDGKRVNLSYKTTEKSLLSEYFNIKAHLASNFVEIEVYLSPTEYYRLKNGALVHFDSDLYEVVEIEGYDATGFNPTTLRIMKKVV